MSIVVCTAYLLGRGSSDFLDPLSKHAVLLGMKSHLTPVLLHLSYLRACRGNMGGAAASISYLK